MSTAVEEEKRPITCTCCTEKFTSSIRKLTLCPYCKEGCCMSCQKAYLLSSPHDAHCMFCKTGWNEDFLRETFSNAWLEKQYSEVEWNRLWDREKNLLPDTQRQIEREQLSEVFRRENWTIRQEMNPLKQILSSMLDTTSIHSFYIAWQQWLAIQDKTLSNIHFISSLDEHQISLLDRNSNDEKKQRTTVTRPCPAPDCRGMLSSHWKCGLCETKVCHVCLAIKRLGAKGDEDEKHQCKLEDIETAKLIQSETKNCPKCGVSIFKIHGCNQMFCTNCNTPFDWKTGQIINGAIHNPHYFEWMQATQGGQATQAARPPHEGNCENEFKHNVMTALSRHAGGSRSASVLYQFIRSANHIRQYGVPILFRGIPDNLNMLNSDLRYKYLKQQLSQEDFRSTAMKRFKRYKMMVNARQMREMLFQAGLSIINTIDTSVFDKGSCTRYQVEKHLEEYYVSIKKLMEYYNNSLRGLFERYKSDAMFEVFSDAGQMVTKTRKSVL